jgi:hypothetical protein
MKISVSELKDYLTCPAFCHHRYVSLRGPEPAEALAIGSAVHQLLAHKLGGAIPPIAACEVAGHLALAVNAWEPPADWRVCATEIAMSLPLAFYGDDRDIELVGTLDAIVEWNGSFWHLQHKTLAPGIPPGVYAEQQRTDWHECAYQAMAEQAGYRPFAGTILNLLRKLSESAIRRNPEAALSLQYVNRTYEEVAGAMVDITTLAQRIHDERLWRERPMRNRAACAGPYRNSLCTYKDVCDGVTTIDDPRYVALEPRYAEASDAG